MPRREPSPPPDDALYREIVDNALLASGSRYVHMSLLEDERRVSRIVAWNCTPARPWRKAQQLAEKIAPGFNPSRLVVPVDPSRGLGRVYYEETPVIGRLEDLAAGILDPRITRLAITIARVRHVLAAPLQIHGRIAGSLVFATARPLSRNQVRVCEAFARQAALTLERTLALPAAAPPQAMDSQGDPAEQEANAPRSLEYGDLRLDLIARRATRAGVPLRLTPTEYNLLLVFMESPERAFSRAELAETVWGMSLLRNSNFVDVAVAGLRKKLESGQRPRVVHAVRGHGYALRMDPQ